MGVLYRVVGISKQAVSKAFLRQKDFKKRLSELVVEVDILREEHPGCGVEKMYDTLKPPWLGRDKFIEIFMGLGYKVRKVKNYMRTTIPGPYHYPNLIEGLLVYKKNQLWQTDITYYPIGSRFYYICFIVDVYTREIIGYNVSDTLRTESNMKALQMAFKNNKGTNLEGLIHHSDRGCQYTSNEYTEALRRKGICISMSKIAQENAYAERINGIIKNEYLKYRDIKTIEQLKTEVRRSVKNYNEKRIHRSLPKGETPISFSKSLLTLSDQKKPMVIVYTEGNFKIREVSNLSDFRPEKGPLVHVCPIVIS